MRLPLPRPCVLLPLIAMLAIGCHQAQKHATVPPQQLVFPHEWTGNIDKSNFNEPSGAVIHPERGTLFIVGDEGDIAELQTDGAVVQSQTLRDGADLEGITRDPSTGLLYVAVEGEEKLLEVGPDTLKVRRTFVINRTFEGEPRMDEAGDGIEGVTFIQDADHPEGGVFIVAHQSFTLDDPTEPSALMRVEVPLRTGRGRELEARIVGLLEMPIIDMSALHYDDKRDVVYALSDAHNVMLTVDHHGRIIDTCAFPGNDQEGLAMGAERDVFIAQDSGGVLTVKWLR